MDMLQVILSKLYIIIILTSFIGATQILNRRMGKASETYIDLLNLLTEVNLKKILYGSTASAMIRCTHDSPIVYWLKKGLIKGLDRHSMTMKIKNDMNEFRLRLLNMMFGKEEISITTIHTAMNEVKIFLIEKLDKTELYLVISTALYIFIPILTLLSLTLIKQSNIAVITIIGVGIIFELINRVVAGWIKT